MTDQTDFYTNAERIAEAFVAARREGRALQEYPGERPASLEAAYRIQDAALTLDGRTVAGWKVGRINPPVDGANRLVGPIFVDQLVTTAADEMPPMPIFADGFGAAEAEFMLRVGTDLDPAKSSYTIEEARAAIDAVYIGMEIASSPFPGINDNGPAVTVSDFGNNYGLVIGSMAEGWRDRDINDWTVDFWIDGRSINSATTATMLDGPFGAARFLFENLAARGIKVSAGQWISSGAITGVHVVRPGETVVSRFDGRFTVGCEITAL